jgi:hypothetical protein
MLLMPWKKISWGVINRVVLVLMAILLLIVLFYR